MMLPRSGRDWVSRRRVLRKSALLGAAALTPAFAGESQITPKTKRMSEELSADEIRSLLNLEPNATCGFVRVTFLSTQSIGFGGLPAPFADGRPLGSALYFLVTPGAPVRLHRIRNDQLYHYYLGDPLELFLLHGDGTTERIIVGPDLRGGQRVQLLIPGNTFHTARLVGQGRWFLGASTEWPGVTPTDVEIGNLDELCGKYPGVDSDLRAIAASVRHVPPSGAAPR
jgi:predicted cupin superfamily sugar epimerase